MHNVEIVPFVKGATRAKQIVEFAGLSGKDLTTAQDKRFKASLAICTKAVATHAEASHKDLLNEIAAMEDMRRNDEVKGLAVSREVGIRLIAIQERVKANTDGPGWQAYCAARNQEVGSSFPSKAQANNAIKLARFGSSIPATDELGQPWNMKSFIRWTASGCSLEKNNVELLPVLEYARAQKTTKTKALTPDYLRSIADAAGHPKLAKRAASGTKSGARHTEKAKAETAKAQSMTNRAKGIFAEIQAATMAGVEFSVVSKTDRTALLKLSGQIAEHVAMLDAAADAAKPAKRTRAKSSK